MPFQSRSVEPRRVCRLRDVQGCSTRALTDRDSCCLTGAHGYKDGKTHLFTCLEEVCCHTLFNIIHQLSDLSRHASHMFLEIEAEAGLLAKRSNKIQLRLETLQSTVRSFDHKKIKIPVSNLDDESRWTVHYTAPWHQQENVFLPGNRPACVEDLHRQAKVNLKTALRECDKLRKDGFRSSQYYSQGPVFSSSAVSHHSLQEDDDIDKRSTSASSVDDEKIAYPSRPLTPLMGGGQDISSVPLPTPEQKMREQAQAVPADIIPINISGETFDRQASVRRSLVNTDTVVRRSKKVKRRKTITGVPDNVQKELGKGSREFRAQSMYIPGQFSTLGRVGSMNSSLRRSETRDSSCQTEEIKIVPPSVRRIRAQRGQGIAAQMAGLSASSSGNISAASLDGSSTGTAYAYASQLNGGGPRFHSLPRQGARVSLSAEPIYSSAPCRPEDYQASSKIAKLQADETVVHMRCAPKTATPSLPKSQPVERALQGDPAPLLVSPHAAYSTSLIPNATLSSIAQVITLHTSGHAHSDQTIAPQPPAPPGADMGSQCSELDAPSESSCYSDGSFQNSAASTADQWVYDTPENVLPKRPLTSSCSTPINQLYGSLERPSNRADSDSLCSVDNDGFYTSMRLDSGLKSRSHGNIPAARHSMYECQQLPYAGLEDRASLYSNRSLSRSISLRKSKKPPLPPARTDSLRRKPDKNVTSNGAALNETLIASLQQSLVQGGLKERMAGSSPSQSPCSDYEDPWVLRPRSQSSTSAGSSGMSANVYSLCPVTPPQSDTSSLRSDYAEWGCYAERPRSPIARSISVGGTPLGCQANRPQVPLPLPLPLTQDIPKPKAATTSSPDRVHRLTSPSSGYSSQSNTPTAGTPVPSFVKTRSPAGARPKPKVPERKSSLLSSMSISSSSTSLSSNTSDSARTPVLPPPFPSMSPAFSPPALPLPATPEVSKNPPPYVVSPVFPSPPPEVMVDAVHPVQNAVSPPPPPPPLPSSAPVVPQLPPLPPTAPPTSMPLDMKSLKEALKSVGPLAVSHTPNGVNHNLNGVNKPELNYTGSPVPLITAQALQMVQLRSVKRPESLENTEVTTIRAQETRNDQEFPNFSIAEKAKKPEPPTVLPLQSCAAPAVNGTNKPPTPISMFHPDLPQNFIAETAPEATANTDLCRNATLLVQACSPSEPADDPSHPAQIDQQSSPAEVSFNITCSLTPKQKPPVATKKPKLSLLLSPIQTLPKTTPETPPKTPPQTPTPPTPSLQLKGQLCADVPLGSQNDTVILEPDHQVGAEETESVTTSLRQSVESLGYSFSAQSLLATNDPAPSPAPVAQELPLSGDKSTSDGDRDEDGETNEDRDSNGDRGAHGNGDRNEDKDSEGDQDADGDGDGDTSEDKDSEGDQDADVDADGYSDGGSSPRSSISPKNKESDRVFDPSTTNSSPAASTNGEDLEEMETPTRPRTTEDLFAAIHRSKRKVLGRRESEEDRSRSHSPSPPVTPTGISPGLASSLPRPAGSIQRTMRKSATSSDSFKALLLRKGSRSETSFRMSATEMLRSTDPRFQRTRSESSLDPPLSPLVAPDSPGRGSRRAQEDWARCEGALPRSLTGCTTPSKHGRPRAPPMAASSKYNARSRILSSPMTVIREGESELGEAADSGSQAAGPVDSTDTLREESS